MEKESCSLQVPSVPIMRYIVSSAGIHDTCKVLFDAAIAERCPFVAECSEMYVGGSLPSFLISKHLKEYFSDDTCKWNEICGEGTCSLQCIENLKRCSGVGTDTPNDVDIYTTDHMKTTLFINKHRSEFTDITIDGCIITATVCATGYRVQFITAEITDMREEVLGMYDCDMVAVGYHPYKQTILYHKRFFDALEKGGFSCRMTKAGNPYSNEERNEKLLRRAQAWYGMKLAFFDGNGDVVPPAEGKGVPGTFGYHLPPTKSPYHADDEGTEHTSCARKTTLENVLFGVSPPTYLQLFHKLYHCVKCGTTTTNLICSDCKNGLTSYNVSKPEKSSVTIIGGINGFGAIVADAFFKDGWDVCVTGRKPTGAKPYRELTYDLASPAISAELGERLCNRTDVLVLNATKTLDENESVWNTTLETFDQRLLMDRLNVNLLGYISFLQQLVSMRRTVCERESPSRLSIVYVDANESKCEGKMIDGKHLELNIAKAAVKQLFYTNANLLAKTNASTVCYDPGWMSYHGVSIEKKRSRSPHLLPPTIAAKALIHFATESLPVGKTIIDRSVYEFIKLIQIVD